MNVQLQAPQAKCRLSAVLWHFTHPMHSQSLFHAPHAPAQARALPIPLCSFEPPLSKQFALRQLALMAREQLTQEAAFTRVEKEMMPQLLALTQ